MGILDRILGSDKAPKQGQATQQRGQPADDQAIARYRYLLKTAPPETIEQAATRLTDNQAAQQLNEARRRLFQSIHRRSERAA